MSLPIRTSELLSNFIQQVNPTIHKLVIQVFDENRITRDDFLGMVELSLRNLPRERADESIESKIYYLQPKRCVL